MAVKVRENERRDGSGAHLFSGPRAGRPRDSRRGAGATFCGAILSAGLVALLSQATDLFYVVQAVD